MSVDISRDLAYLVPHSYLIRREGPDVLCIGI